MRFNGRAIGTRPVRRIGGSVWTGDRDKAGKEWGKCAGSAFLMALSFESLFIRQCALVRIHSRSMRVPEQVDASNTSSFHMSRTNHG